ncbi:hypothetical protein EA462_11640 [Natrarchaeobius halalkaliphilus]|uniref:PGF-CTERM sorting domain-containing protein n=1 Tax=Natrarchaeobius halalkaliphilus TaxID=1679091 RepID=A0A3N6M0U5_9EURY|nr:hypothetical protein EA462_11640 [Natrarchaeobius halalkaliphilus]
MAVTLAVIVGLSMVAMGGMHGVSAAEPDQPEYDVDAVGDFDDAGDTLGSADELYVEDDGSGVLVYTDDGDDDIDEFQLGADVSEGLAHVLIAGENDGDEDIEGEMSASLEEDLFSADGHLTMEQPPELDELDVEISGEQTEETSEFDADIYALFSGDSDDADTQQLSTAGAQTQQQSLFESASTSGDVEVAADTFRTSGDVHVDLGTSAMGDSPDETFSFELSETADGYEIAVSERQTEFDSMFSDPVEEWETEAKAKATLEEQYAEMAEELGGEVTVEIDHHDFDEHDENTYWKELDYTVTYEGIEEGLQDALTEELVDDPQTDLSVDDAERIAAQVTELEIETVEFEMISSDEEFEATWNVQINEYAAAIEAIGELGEASMDDEDLFEDEFEEFDDMFEAQQAADLRTTFEWDATAEFTDDNQIELEAQATGDTENYDAYTDELADRGIDAADEEVVFEFTAYTEGEEVYVDGTVEIGMDDLAEEVLTSMTTVIQDESDELGSFASTLEDSELEIAKVDVDFDSETVELEAGAKFENTESLIEDGILGDNVAVTQIAGEDEDGDVVTYVYIEDLETDDELSESTLAELGLVDDDTEVYEPGEGDREFAEMDTERAADFLDVDLSGDDGIPGFGLAAALVALSALVATLLARRT